MKLRHILCATDFSEPARAALHAAVELVEMSGGRLTLLHVTDLSPLLFNTEAALALPNLIESVASAGDTGLTAWKEEALRLAPKLAIEAVRVEGAPWHQIVDYANTHEVDLIVIATHGRTGLKHVLLGSVAERVARHAKRPVLIVPGAGSQVVNPPPNQR